MPGEVWTLAEWRDGSIQGVSFELLAWGSVLARKLDVPLCSVLIAGKATDDETSELIGRGADKVYCLEHKLLSHFLVEPYAAVLLNLVKARKPEIFLAAATTTGRTLMPYLAAKLATGLTADCTGLDIEEGSGNLIQTRPAIGGNVLATIKTPHHRPQMATVRPRSKQPLPPDPSRKGEVIREKVPDKSLRSRVVFERFEPMDKEEVSLEEADFVVAAGKGIGRPENLALVRELAKALGAAVGASREVVDRGWIEYPHQVGLSGKTVSPRLYLAVGVSGAIQHLAGMQTAKTIVAINRDPEAQIFRIADFGIVGDLFEVLPVLSAKLKTLKSDTRS